MGGYGCGGHNKTHDQVEEHKFFRVDSFALLIHIKCDKYLYYKDYINMRMGNTVIRYNVKDKRAEILVNDTYYALWLSWVDNINGKSKRLYFYCPVCGKRVRYLYKSYKNGFYLCRECNGLNYKSQQVGKREELLIKMYHIVVDKLGYYDWRQSGERIEYLMMIPKPHYMHWDKFSALLNELRNLQDEYYAYELSSLLQVIPKDMATEYKRKWF